MRELLDFGLVYRFEFSAVFTVLGYIVVVIAGYLLGSLSPGIIISRLIYKDDIRNHGSGGTGMTNMLRTYGKPAAAATFIIDGAKAVIAVLIGIVFFGSTPQAAAVYAGAYVGGLAAVVGHAFPVYHKFKGGKSVAVTLFMVIVTTPVIALMCFAVFALIVWGTKYLSVGSIMTVMMYPLILNRLTGFGLHNVIAIFIMLIVVLLHRENIKRVWAGTENRFSLRSKKKAGGSVPQGAGDSSLQNKNEKENEGK